MVNLCYTHRCYRCIKNQILSLPCIVWMCFCWGKSILSILVISSSLSTWKINVHLTSIIKSAQIFLIWEHPFNVNLLFLLLISIKVLKTLRNSWSHWVKSELPNSRPPTEQQGKCMMVSKLSCIILWLSYQFCFPLHRGWNFQPNTQKFWHKA